MKMMLGRLTSAAAAKTKFAAARNATRVLIRISSRSPAELLPVKLFERIQFRSDGVLVHELRLHRVPPFIIGLLEFLHDFGMLSRQVSALAWIGHHVKELPLLLARFGHAD